MPFVYILKCSDGSLYTGSTTDLKKRVHEHNNLKSAAHYTKIRRPVYVVYSEELETLSLARKKEVALKKLTREEKITLISKTLSKAQE